MKRKAATSGSSGGEAGSADSRKEKRRKKKKDNISNVPSNFLWIASLVVLVSVAHSAHLHVLFENDRFFSHLSSLERELSFRTEMGLYFSYFKTIVAAPSFAQGFLELLHDNMTEYPDTINTLQRFNLYPEVIIGGVFRVWHAVLSLYGSSGVECHQIDRGYEQPAITACNGLGDPAYFYVWTVFALNGCMAGVLFILGTFFSGRYLGGFLSLCCFFFNHGEATRVMWTPPLRESFALPFLLLQTLAITYCIRKQLPSLLDYAAVCAMSVLFLLPWQFSQFVLVTQCLSLLVLHISRLLPPSHIRRLYWTLAAALLINILVQFANSLLLMSLLPCTVLACLLVVHCQCVFDQIPWKLLRMCVEVICVLLLMVAVKVILQLLEGGTGDDAHIVAIFLSKVSSYQDFHTQLYTCSAEFDFLPLEYVQKLSMTLLLPAAGLTAVTVVVSLLRHLCCSGGLQAGGGDTATHVLAEQMYHVTQTAAYMCLAVMIMRLKLFLTPQLCIIVALLAKPKFLPGMLSPRWLVGLLVLASSFKGAHNLWQQWSVIGEFNNPEMEELVLWANSDAVVSEAVFAGAMPTMAALRLSTAHPIVNHPHYEDAGLRRRTKEVYTVYSRKPAHEVYSALSGLRVTHVMVEQPWCMQRNKPGCSLGEVWDHEDTANQGLPLFCELVLHDNVVPQEYFRRVFANSIYHVLELA